MKSWDDHELRNSFEFRVQEAFGFLIFSGVIERDQLHEMG